MSLAHNLLLTRSESLGAGGWIRAGALAEQARGLIERFRVKAGGPQAVAKSLSGGNLQKFIVGREIAARHGMTITVLGRAEMEQEKMGSFLCVAQGTPEEPRHVALEHRGGAPDQQPIVLIGKGLCFDTGGISLKDPGAMDEMKFDMSGAATVIGMMSVVAELGLNLNVVGLVPTCENMPSGRAIKPGDIVTSAAGLTVEILNTDAEGRLVLADGLAYAVENLDPELAWHLWPLQPACWDHRNSKQSRTERHLPWKELTRSLTALLAMRPNSPSVRRCQI